VLAIPATRPHPDDRPQFVLSETPSGTPPALHYWFPPGEVSGFEFLTPTGLSFSGTPAAPKQLQTRPSNPDHAQSSADFYALREVLLHIESGKFGAARDLFRRNYFLEQNREGATTSFLLALLMNDADEARRSFQLVDRFDPERTRVMSQLNVAGVVESLPAKRSNFKTSRTRRFLLNLAMEMTDDTLARSAIVAYEAHVVKGDPLPVEMALDRRIEEKQREQQWILAQEQIARLNDCVKSLLNKVGAIEYSASFEAKAGLFGSVKLRVVLNQRRLNDLDAIVRQSHQVLCDRHSKLERLIAQRNGAVAHELDALRAALRQLDRHPGSITSSQFGYLRNWEKAPASGISRDVMALAEAANSPLMRPSVVFRSGDGYVQINIAGSLARLAEWAGL
jgi:hypothetical protein